tara:strand:- start:7004 stop:7336 length:333 start_codon:yes stop_codon:yes gene_type:complete
MEKIFFIYIMFIGIRNMDAQELLTSSYERNTKLLFKSFLILIEDLNKDHVINFHKLRKALPSEYNSLVDQADYFDQHKLQYLRKRILDMGNDSIRSSESSFENFTINFKF